MGRKVHSTMAESALGLRADTVTLQVHAQLLELREAAEGAGHVLAAVVALGGGGKVKSSTQGSGSRPVCGGGSWELQNSSWDLGSAGLLGSQIPNAGALIRHPKLEAEGHRSKTNGNTKRNGGGDYMDGADPNYMDEAKGTKEDYMEPATATISGTAVCNDLW